MSWWDEGKRGWTFDFLSFFPFIPSPKNEGDFPEYAIWLMWQKIPLSLFSGDTQKKNKLTFAYFMSWFIGKVLLHNHRHFSLRYFSTRENFRILASFLAPLFFIYHSTIIKMISQIPSWFFLSLLLCDSHEFQASFYQIIYNLKNTQVN